MKQISNTLIIKKQNLNLLSSEPKPFLYGFNFINHLKRSLNKKGVLLVNSNLHFSTNASFFNLKLFFKTSKSKIYKLNFNTLKLKKTLGNYKNFRINKFFLIQFKSLKKIITILKINNLNKEIDLKIVKFVYINFKRFINILFARRFNLFIDFVKLTSLFIISKIDSNTYLYILGQIFRLLTKKKHSRFMYFLKYLFTRLIKSSLKSQNLMIKGIKFIINGKILGKPRSSSSRLLVGSVPIQTIEANISFSKTHVYTLYGVFGFKFWVFYF